MVKVNLDALIPREDFEIKASTKPIKKIESIAIRDITPDSFFFFTLFVSPTFKERRMNGMKNEYVSLLKVS